MPFLNKPLEEIFFFCLGKLYSLKLRILFI